MNRIFLSLCFALAACCPSPAASGDVVAMQGVAAPCSRECAAYAKLGCEEAKPTLGGQTCQDVCIAAANVGAPPQPACAERSTSCPAAIACRTRP